MTSHVGLESDWPLLALKHSEIHRLAARRRIDSICWTKNSISATTGFGQCQIAQTNEQAQLRSIKHVPALIQHKRSTGKRSSKQSQSCRQPCLIFRRVRKTAVFLTHYLQQKRGTEKTLISKETGTVFSVAYFH